MEDQRVGIAVRTVRIKQGKRQSDVARAAEVSSATVSRIERGHLDTLALRTVRRVCAVLEIRVELAIRSRGGDLDRMIAARHAKLAESVIRTLHDDSPDWQLFPEVSFAFWGERGVVDILAWHPGRRALLIIELKTEIVDVGEMLGTLDKKRRLGPEIAAQRGWDAESVSVWVIVSGGRTNERRVSEFRSTLRTALPNDGRQIRAWLAQPVGPIAAMSFWSAGRSAAATAPPATTPIRRVRPVCHGRRSAKFTSADN